MKDQRYKAILSLLLIATLLTGCTAIKLINSTKISDPQIKFVDHKVGKPTKEKVSVALSFDAYNPNKIGLRNVSINYELYTEGKRFLKGENIKLELTPMGNTKLVVPVEVIYKDVFHIIESLTKKIIFREKTIPVLVKITIHGAPTVYNEVEQGSLFSFTFGFNEIIDVPIPYDELKKAEVELKQKVDIELDKLRKMF